MIRYKFNHMKIKLRRIELGIQQQTLARELGIHRQSLCDIEKGRNTPGMKTMLRICSLLDLKPSDLISSESEGYEPTVSSSIPFQT